MNAPPDKLRWAVTLRDPVHIACRQEQYRRLVAREALNTPSPRDAEWLIDCLRDLNLSPQDFTDDVDARRKGEPPRQFAEADDLKIAQYIEPEPLPIA